MGVERGGSWHQAAFGKTAKRVKFALIDNQQLALMRKYQSGCIHRCGERLTYKKAFRTPKKALFDQPAASACDQEENAFFLSFSVPGGGLSRAPLREKSSISEELFLLLQVPKCTFWPSPACARPSSRQHGCSGSQTAFPDSAGSLSGPFFSGHNLTPNSFERGFFWG